MCWKTRHSSSDAYVQSNALSLRRRPTSLATSASGRSGTLGVGYGRPAALPSPVWPHVSIAGSGSSPWPTAPACRGGLFRRSDSTFSPDARCRALPSVHAPQSPVPCVHLRPMQTGRRNHTLSSRSRRASARNPLIIPNPTAPLAVRDTAEIEGTPLDPSIDILGWRTPGGGERPRCGMLRRIGEYRPLRS